ncbi:uncharacterized protein TNCT_208881 [Trichonephila clavata]|uniref:Tetratricopeptide repeat protein n=1 Tax=Trichonephila clavata TaxID=2740835 RepID=A0A8X6GYI6_TRICU|nr:uncharacterized protein TNCT_208881 [Trichonephila clavata]
MDIIEKKLEDNRDTLLARVALKHITVLEKYAKDVKSHGKGAFLDRQEYQRFAIASFFFNTLGCLQTQPDSSLTEFRQLVDDKTPSLKAFHLSNEEKEARKGHFCKKIDKGDVLHLKVVEESESEYRLLVLNKYGESERLVDYSIYAYLINTYHLKRLGRTLKVSDYFRATVLGKLKKKENVFSKLLVSVNAKFVKEKYEGIELGFISKDDIPFFPQDISKYKSMFEYLKNKPFENCKVAGSRMASLGLDPYKIYSFHKSVDGKKYEGPRDIDPWIKKFQRVKKSLELLHEVESAHKRSDFECGLDLLNQEIEYYPINDILIAFKGRMYKDLWLMEKNPEYFIKALECYKKAHELNPYNQILKNDLHEIYVMSVKESLRKNDDSPALQQALMQIAKDKEFFLKWKNSSGELEENISLENLNLNEEGLLLIKDFGF